MELTEAIAEGEWSSLNEMYTTEEAAFMAQLLSNSNSYGGSFGLSSSTYWSVPESAAAMAALEEASYERASSSNFYRFSQESSDFSSENYHLVSNNACVSTNFGVGNLENNGCFHLEDENMSERNVQQLNIEADDQLTKPEPAIEDEGNKLQSSKKRAWGSEEVHKKKNKKTQKLTSTSNNEEDGNCGHSRQSTSSYCSEDESNASQELNGGANSGLSPKGKTRASRGSATDPQSLYARKRRERINERLKILQNLVPNGTKVDISTMLEEAVEYVKFLQLQIKLLSSDDLWMYAPIAYNGMDIGLNLKLNSPKES